MLRVSVGARATDVLYSGAIYSPAEAYAIGLVSEVVAAEALLDRAHAIARERDRTGPARAPASSRCFVRRSPSRWRGARQSPLPKASTSGPRNRPGRICAASRFARPASRRATKHDAHERNPVRATHSFGVNTTKPITLKPTSTSGGPHTATRSVRAALRAAAAHRPEWDRRPTDQRGCPTRRHHGAGPRIAIMPTIDNPSKDDDEQAHHQQVDDDADRHECTVMVTSPVAWSS